MEQSLPPMPSTPKTPIRTKAELTRDDRLWIHALYYDGDLSQAQIVLRTGYTRNQVQYALSHRLTPQKRRCGRKKVLNTPERKRLVEWVTASSYNRQVKWSDIPRHLSWNCGLKAIQTAFAQEGFVRRYARYKPPLTENDKKARLE